MSKLKAINSAQSKRVEPQGTFINVWLDKAGKLATSIHNGRKNADSAKRTKAKRVGVIRYSRRKGLEVVS